MRGLRIGLAQINVTVGDFAANGDKIISVTDEARRLGVDLLVFPELAVSGYPPEDMLLKPRFIRQNIKALERVAARCLGITAVIGFVDDGEAIYNAAAVCADGQIAAKYHKIFLPNYGVFDEARYFTAGADCPVYPLGEIKVGITICEDLWHEGGPAATQAGAGAEVIVNLSASPYHFGKSRHREQVFGERAREGKTPVAFCNLVGGQDELVFDGASLILDRRGQVIARGKSFAEDLIIADLDMADAAAKPELPARDVKPPEYPAEVYDALVLGTRDYVLKNGFSGVVIGLSGGIDSSLVAAVSADALGAAAVTGVAMPSRYSSPESLGDAQRLAKNLDIKLLNLPFDGIFQTYLEVLKPVFEGQAADLTEENIQARIRGNLLMALSNKFGWLVLTTGNKSEVSTGYGTLYGDMAGGFAVIKDVSKTVVYELCRHRNRLAGRDIIPQSVLSKEPSAELRPEQKDSDSLPPYEVLDPILSAYVEENKSVAEIIAMGLDEAAVRQTARLVNSSEFKRRQAPPGVKITPLAFGRDRRLPITNRFRE